MASSVSSPLSASASDSALYDTKWAWMVVFCGFMITFLVSGIQHSGGLFMEIFLVEFHADVPTVSWPFSLSRGFAQLGGVVVIPLTKLVGVRVMACSGLFVASLAFLVSSYAEEIGLLYLFYGVIGGISVSMSTVPGSISATLIFDRRRGLALGIISSGGGAGQMVIAPLSALLNDKYGWRWTFRIYAIGLFSFISLAFLMTPQNPCTTIKEGFLTVANYWTLLKNPLPFPICFSSFVVALGLTTPILYIPIYAIHLGIRVEQSAYLLSAMGISNTATRIVIGFFIDLKILNGLIIYILGITAAGTTTIFAFRYTNYGLLFMYSILYGGSYGWVAFMKNIVMLQLMGKALFYEISSFVVLFAGLGTIAGPPTAGYIYVAVDKLHYVVFLFAGAMILLGALMWTAIAITAFCYKGKRRCHKHHQLSECVMADEGI